MNCHLANEIESEPINKKRHVSCQSHFSSRRIYLTDCKVPSTIAYPLIGVFINGTTLTSIKRDLLETLCDRISHRDNFK